MRLLEDEAEDVVWGEEGEGEEVEEEKMRMFSEDGEAPLGSEG